MLPGPALAACLLVAACCSSFVAPAFAMSTNLPTGLDSATVATIVPQINCKYGAPALVSCISRECCQFAAVEVLETMNALILVLNPGLKGCTPLDHPRVFCALDAQCKSTANYTQLSNVTACTAPLLTCLNEGINASQNSLPTSSVDGCMSQINSGLLAKQNQAQGGTDSSTPTTKLSGAGRGAAASEGATAALLVVVAVAARLVGLDQARMR